jgi:hypothetical protein
MQEYTWEECKDSQAGRWLYITQLEAKEAKRHEKELERLERMQLQQRKIEEVIAEVQLRTTLAINQLMWGI